MNREADAVQDELSEEPAVWVHFVDGAGLGADDDGVAVGEPARCPCASGTMRVNGVSSFEIGGNRETISLRVRGSQRTSEIRTEAVELLQIGG